MKRNEKGFSLTELLVVVAIIAVIAVIAIPSIIVINNRVNKRLYNEKVESVTKAAEVYAADNPNIFDGKTEAKIYVGTLIENDYIKEETSTDCGDKAKNSEGQTVESVYNAKCIINPTSDNKDNMNGDYVIIKKEAVGLSVEYNGDVFVSTSDSLLTQVCTKLANGKAMAVKDYSAADEKGYFIGKSSTGSDSYCNCDDVKSSGAKACLISGDTKSNYLKYNDVMWRVMGVYLVDGNKYVKIINDDNVEINIE